MNKTEYLASLITGKEAIAEQRLEKEYPNGDKVYVVDIRHVDSEGIVFYMEERFVVLSEGLAEEEAIKMR